MESREVRKKKKICVVTTNRSDYGRMKPIMEAIRKRDDLELQVVAGTPFFFDHLLWYMRHGMFARAQWRFSGGMPNCKVKSN